MPTHITSKNYRVTKLTLAGEALRRVGVVDEATGLVYVVPSKRHVAPWRDMVAGMDIVDMAIMSESKGLSRTGRWALRAWLVRNGFVCIGRNLYQRQSGGGDGR